MKFAFVLLVVLASVVATVFVYSILRKLVIRILDRGAKRYIKQLPEGELLKELNLRNQNKKDIYR